MATNPIVDKIIAIGKRRRAPASHVKAALETGRVESNFTNPAGGDADSAGWRQERASLYKDPTNLDASINRFYDEAAKLDHGQKSGELAADIQRPRADLRGRYNGASREAQNLLNKRGAGGASPGVNPQAVTSSVPATGGGENAASARRAALQQYVLNKDTDPNSLLNLSAGLRAAKDVPDTPAATSTRAGLTARKQASSKSSASGRYPTGKTGKIIGTPYAGTHSLGNWQSDNAVDIAVPIGTPMVALQDGVIVKVTKHPQGAGRFAGDQVTVRGANGNEYFYAHGKSTVKAGQKVRKGESLGSTGSANGVEHLHFGQKNGDPRQHTKGE